MGLPGHHRTSSDKRKRSAHFGLKAFQPTVCPKCKKPVMPHRACEFCGFYKGREVVAIKVLKALKPVEAKAPKAKKPAVKKAKKEAPVAESKS